MTICKALLGWVFPCILASSAFLFAACKGEKSDAREARFHREIESLRMYARHRDARWLKTIAEGLVPYLYGYVKTRPPAVRESAYMLEHYIALRGDGIRGILLHVKEGGSGAKFRPYAAAWFEKNGRRHGGGNHAIFQKSWDASLQKESYSFNFSNGKKTTLRLTFYLAAENRERRFRLK